MNRSFRRMRHMRAMSAPTILALRELENVSVPITSATAPNGSRASKIVLRSPQVRIGPMHTAVRAIVFVADRKGGNYDRTAVGRSRSCCPAVQRDELKRLAIGNAGSVAYGNPSPST